MDLVDSKFIGLVSSRLEKFHKVKPNLYNFRCPICGDSKKYKTKTRGYLYTVKVNTNYKCHNCGASMSLSNFLKKVDPVIHKQYIFEKFKSGYSGKATVTKEPEFNFEAPKFKTKINLPLCSKIDRARSYLEEGRRIDSSKFYYAENFKDFVSLHNKIDGKNLRKEERIVIPLYYKSKLIGVQGRALDSNSIKYITVMFYDDAPKIYGLDNIRTGTPVFVTEGPFDSTFLCNSIAMCGADCDVRKWGISDPVWVYDNEPRNSEIVKRISDTIDRGEKVVIWPNGIYEKDINDMVLSGLDVQLMVESNTYNGLEAQLKFTTWKRI